jgi:hypothetical protein
MAQQATMYIERDSRGNCDNKGKKSRFYSERKKMQEKIPASPVKKWNCREITTNSLSPHLCRVTEIGTSRNLENAHEKICIQNIQNSLKMKKKIITQSNEHIGKERPFFKIILCNFK